MRRRVWVSTYTAKRSGKRRLALQIDYDLAIAIALGDRDAIGELLAPIVRLIEREEGAPEEVL